MEASDPMGKGGAGSLGAEGGFGPPRFLETVKLQDGRYRLLELHQRRLARTWTEAFGREPGFRLADVLPPPPDGGLYRARVRYPGPDVVPTVTLHDYAFPCPETLRLVRDPGLDYRLKFFDRTAIDALKASCGASDFILVRDGGLTDTSIANLVFEGEGGLFTPHGCLLAGVKRESLLMSGRISARRIGPEDLGMYRKVFLVNAMIDLEDDVSVPTGRIHKEME
ncbi:MAG: branched-chain amino acid aminotransferase [Deltaproteobacteria bacterium]|nr:branched-chain amino acid aminotransferase [Deltaproteobacteria bacterium]